MKRRIMLNGRVLEYDLQYKNVKNLYLRIKPDLSLHVSANRYVTLTQIEEFLRKNEIFIVKALERYSKNPPAPAVTDCTKAEADELLRMIDGFVRLHYPKFSRYCKEIPTVRLRRMRTRWGSCTPAKCEMHFSTMLCGKPPELVEYVVLHELTHFIYMDHSEKFYASLQQVCPDWKEKRKRLNGREETEGRVKGDF